MNNIYAMKFFCTLIHWIKDIIRR